MRSTNYLQKLIQDINTYWHQQGCVLSPSYDYPMGAATFHPHSFLKVLAPGDWNVAFPQVCRRPTDGRYGLNPYRMSRYLQYQVILKPVPENFLDLYLGSLKFLGLSLENQHLVFLEDNWESPTLGAAGLGWEVRYNGLEITQITYFQMLGSESVPDVVGEITYGVERLYTALTGVPRIDQMAYSPHQRYCDVMQNEREFSRFYFEHQLFKDMEVQFDIKTRFFDHLLQNNLIEPAYDILIEMSHLFNQMDARGVLTVTHRQQMISHIRQKSRAIVQKVVQPSNRRECHLTIHPLSQVCSEEPQDFVIDLGFEDLPYHVLSALEEDTLKWWSLFWKQFMEQTRLKEECPSLSVYVSAKRVLCRWRSIPLFLVTPPVELKGPLASLARDHQGQWTQVALGFAQKNGLEIDHLEIQVRDHKEFLIGKVPSKKIDLPHLIVEHFFSFLNQFALNKHRMRWALSNGEEARFPRPLRRLVVVWGTDHLRVSFLGVESQNMTFVDTPYCDNDRVPIRSIADYDREPLTPLSRAERITLLKRQVESLDLSLNENLEAFLSFWATIYAHPYVELLKMPRTYDHLPYVLRAAIVSKEMHGFLISEDQWLILVSEPLDKSASEMMQRTLESRLEDGDFYLKQDLQKPLEDYRQLAQKLDDPLLKGHLLTKQSRLKQFITTLEPSSADRNQLLKICDYLNLDLTSRMVQEFPDVMTGLMDSLLAEKQSESPDLVVALKEIPFPRTIGDPLPSSPLALCIGCLEGLDYMMSAFSLGHRVRQNDPLKLRRKALTFWSRLGFFEETTWQTPWSLSQMIELAANLHQTDSQVAHELQEFLLQRLKFYLKSLNWDLGLIDYVLDLLAHSVPIQHVAHLVAEISILKKQPVWGDFLKTYHRLRQLLGDQASLRNVYDLSQFRSHIEQSAPSLSELNDFLDRVLVFDPDPERQSENLEYLRRFWDIWSCFGPLHLLHTD